MAKTVQDILVLIKKKDIKMVDFKMVDINGQYRHAIEVGAPKLCLGAILKDKVPPLDFQEAMFARGFFICKNK